MSISDAERRAQFLEMEEVNEDPEAESQDLLVEDEPVLEEEEPEVEEDWDEYVPLITPEGEEPIDGPIPIGAIEDAPTVRGSTGPMPVDVPPPLSFLNKLRTQLPTQLAAAGACCFAWAVGYIMLSDSEPETPEAWAPKAQARFPKVEVQGIDRVVTHEDVARILRARPTPPSVASPSPVTRPQGLQRAAPGRLHEGDGAATQDYANIPVIAGSTEATRRMQAREARQAVLRQRQPLEPPKKTEQELKAARLRKIAHLMYEPGGTLKVETAAKEGTHLRLEVGTAFDVELVVGVSSMAPNMVVARTLKPVKGLSGHVVLTKGAVLRGRAKGQKDRLFLTFRAAKSAGQTYRLEAYAVDKTMPGVRAIIRESSAKDRGKSGAGRGAIGAVGGIVGELVNESLPGRIVRGATEGAVPEAQEALREDEGQVLELPAGRKFQVIVTGDGS